MPAITSSIRIDESHLLHLSSVARKNPTMQGRLVKMDLKGKKGSTKWAVLYGNLLFTYEGDQPSIKPLAVSILEGCQGYPTPVGDGGELEKGFTLSYEHDKTYMFIADNKTERDHWITAINNSSSVKLRQELDMTSQNYKTLQMQLSSAECELSHLKQQQLESQRELIHLRTTLATPRRSSSSVSSADISSPLSIDGSHSYIEDQSARILQSHIRGWLLRCRWRRVVSAYMKSPQAAVTKKRNKLIWKIISTEEDYVNVLTILCNEFYHQLHISSCSNKPPLTLLQVANIFRNCSELLLFHQLLLRGLHNCAEKWPTINLCSVLKLFVPMMTLYHQYVGNHTHAMDVLLDLKSQQNFKDLIKKIENRHICDGHQLEELLNCPLNRIYRYMEDLQELKAHTPLDHVDYTAMCDVLNELEMIQKTVTDEMSQFESIRQVLNIEAKIEGGCDVLLDKEQTLIRKGYLTLSHPDDKLLTFPRKTKRRGNPNILHCFLFSKHFLITQKIDKKFEESYRPIKENSLLPLVYCKLVEHPLRDCPDLKFLGFGITYNEGGDVPPVTHVFVAANVADKAQWVADITQCIENEKENKLLQSKSQGQPVELNSPFMRYCTFKSGKEQLVNCGNINSLLDRLTKSSYFGLDFLNTFLTTYQLYTTSDYVLDYLIDTYHKCLQSKSSITSPPQDSNSTRQVRFSLTPSHESKRSTFPTSSPRRTKPSRSLSHISVKDASSVSGIFFALKHWICKHFHHFKKSQMLDVKLQGFLEEACQEAWLSSHEKRVIVEVSQLYMMQKNGYTNEQCPIMEYLLLPKVHTDSFEKVLSWQPRTVAEQLCLIDSRVFNQIENDELLRYLTCKENKSEMAPNIVNLIQHFNRMSLFWLWFIAKQQSDTHRYKAVEFLIMLGIECYQLKDFMSVMSILGAVDHSTVSRLSDVFDGLPKVIKMHHKTLRKLGSTDSCYRELKTTIRKATPPLIPYLALTITELVQVSETSPNFVEDELINFNKMRKYARICQSVLQYQKESYEFQLDKEIAHFLLSTDIPGDENALYDYVDSIQSKAQSHDD